MRNQSIAALVLIVIGAINWGLVGLFGFNLVTFLFGQTVLTRIIYVVVGLAGVHGILMLSRLIAARDGVCVPGRRWLGNAPHA